jgi:hypothetical protein
MFEGIFKCFYPMRIIKNSHTVKNMVRIQRFIQ